MNVTNNGCYQHESSVPKIVYHPKRRETELVRFGKFLENKFGIEFKDYWELREWSVVNYPLFWDCVWTFFELQSSRPYSQVCDTNSKIQNTTWFKDVLLNFTENILRFCDTRTAIITVDPDDNVEQISYMQLHEEVCVYARALRDAGLRKGDVVACYMSNKKEAIFAFLATASIGAVWSGFLPQLGAMGVLSKLQLIQPKLIFTSTTFFLNNEVSMIQKIAKIVSGIFCLEKVILVPSKTKTEDCSEIPKCVYVSEFLAKARRQQHSGEPLALTFEQVPFDHPIVISFTSGTTGEPKGLVHGCGILLATMKDYGLAQDITRDDVILSCSPSGWNTWNLTVNTLHLGVTLLIYDGDVFESPTRFYDVVDRFGVTSCFVMSVMVESMELKGYLPTSKHSLKSLKQMFAIGSVLRPQSYDFLSEKIKPGLFCSPVYGTTESFGMLSGLDHNIPVHRGEIQSLSLGMDLRVLDGKGESIMGRRGDLVLANPYPGLPVCLLNDPDKEIMTESFLSIYPGLWNTGDFASINPETNGLILYGRSDESIVTPGSRVSCSEINYVLTGHFGVIDTMYVPLLNARNEYEIVLFLKMRPGYGLTKDITEKMKKGIADYLSVFHVPHLILQADDIPYNLTGKKLNRLVTKIINKETAVNIDNVINPSSLQYFKNLNLNQI